MYFELDENKIIKHFKDHTLKDCIYLLIFFSLILVPLYIQNVHYKIITGKVTEILSPNSFVINNRKIMLSKTLLPSSNQVCNTAKQGSLNCLYMAKKHLSNLILNKEITCHWRNRNRDNFLVSICLLNGDDILENLVLTGNIYLAENADDNYLLLQKIAKNSNLGLWNSSNILANDKAN